jgi:hypothetical protein
MMYGRMNALLGGALPNLGPQAGTGTPLSYFNPPTEILTPSDPTTLVGSTNDGTQLWRLDHQGVDTHSIHFHLFDVQVVNRVDWTGIIKPPYPEEVGWKDTIRTNPFEDVIVALRPTAAAMKLPFGIPQSNRLLDVTMPVGSTSGFTPVAPPAGVAAAAQIVNVMTNFMWEYVWHCHLLGHEENDMMRPVLFKVTSQAPAASTLSAQSISGVVNLQWTDPTPFNYATRTPASTLGNPRNEIGYRIERAPGASGGTFTQIGTALANATNYNDTTAVAGNTYRYRVAAWNASGITRSASVAVVPGHTLTVTATATPGTVASGGSVALSAPAVDSLGHSGITYLWNDGGAGGTFSSTTSRTPTYTAPINASGSPVTVTIGVTATCKWTSPWVTGTTSVPVTVQTASTHVLTVTAGRSISPIASGGSTPLTGAALDSMGHGIASWSWSDGGAGGTFIPSASVQNPTYIAAANNTASTRTVTLTLTATCNGLSPVTSSGTTTLSVYVAGTHTVTVTATVTPNPVASGGSTALVATGVDSLNHPGLVWNWSDGGAGGTFSSTSVRNPTYTAPLNGTASQRVITLVVTATCKWQAPWVAGTITVPVTLNP